MEDSKSGPLLKSGVALDDASLIRGKLLLALRDVNRAGEKNGVDDCPVVSEPVLSLLGFGFIGLSWNPLVRKSRELIVDGLKFVLGVSGISMLFPVGIRAGRRKSNARLGIKLASIDSIGNSSSCSSSLPLLLLVWAGMEVNGLT